MNTPRPELDYIDGRLVAVSALALYRRVLSAGSGMLP